MKHEDDSTAELRFPAGMRVLVVDDDNTCLKMMYNLLRRCQYHVTTTNKAKEALRILKRSRDKYDIVISDVEMPDIDGIKLLQLVGLEMNIPVIMLSSYSDTKRVMQGIKNGACDYLVKPVRIQELQNIWQHVVRRNKSITLRKSSPSASGQAPNENNHNAAASERPKGKSPQDNFDSSADDDDNDDEDSGHENEESTHHKKPRLFWTVDLHQKFVDAVNTLGIEKAFPKKILDMMNVQGLTREKVASHLQKYRLYLRKVNNRCNQPASKMSAYDDGPFGGGYGVFRSLAGPYQGTNSSLSHPTMLFQGLNNTGGMSIRGPTFPPMLQTPQLSNSFSPYGKSEPAASSSNPDAAIFQGFPTLDKNKASNMYPPSNSIMSNQNTSEFGNQSSFNVPSSNMGVFDKTGCGVSKLLDPTNWGSLFHPQTLQHNLFTSNLSSDDNIPPLMAQMQHDPADYFRGFSSVDELKGNIQTHGCLNGNENDNGGNFNYLGQSQIWQDNKAGYIPDSANPSSSIIPVVAAIDQNNANISASPFNQLEGISTQYLQQNAVKQSDVEQHMKFDDFLLDDPKLIDGSSNRGSEYLEDMVESFQALKDLPPPTSQPNS